MTIDDALRRLRGTLGNALVFGTGGVALGATAAAGFAVLSALGIVPGGGFGWVDAAFIATGLGIAGAVSGVGFSLVIGLLGRGRKITELSWLRFGLGGGLAAGVLVPLFLQALNLLSGDGLVPWELVLDDGLRMGVLGSLAAAGSIKVAQIAERARLRGSPEEDESLEGGDPLVLEKPREA